MTLFRDVFIVSGSGVGGGSLGYANTLYRARPGVLPRPPVGGARQLGGGAGAPLRHRRADARRHRVPRRGPRRPAAQGAGRGAGRRRDLQADPRRRLLRRARQGGRGPVLRRRGARRARGCIQLRQLHGRLPPRRQEHARQELPLVRRAPRRRDPARAHGHRRRADRRAPTAPTATASRPSTPAPGCASAGARSPRAASSSPPARSAPTGCSRAASSAARCRGSPTASASSCAPTASRSSPSPRPTTSATSRSSIAITSSIYPDPDTHIEVVTYGRAGDAMGFLFTMLTGEGTRRTRPVHVARRRRCATRSASCARCGRSSGRSAR